MVFKKYPLLMLFFLGLILRLSLLFLDYSFDVNNHIVWGKDALSRGFAGFYDIPSSAVFTIHFPNYPPLAIYLFYLCYGLYLIVKTLAWQLNIIFPLFPSKVVFFFEQRAMLAAFFKLPAVFADLGIAFVTVLLARKLFPKKKKLPLLAASLVLFNPAFFYNSALWGQTEAVSIFFLLLSFYFLLFSKQSVIAPVLLTLALLSKQNAIVFLPIFLLLYAMKFKKEEIVRGLIISTLVFWIAFFPFYKNENSLIFPFTAYYQKILTVSGLPFISNHSFNFWALISQWKNILDTNLFFGLQYRYWGYLIAGLFTILILQRLYRNKKQLTQTGTLLGVGLVAYAAFLFLTKIHERHFEQILPFLIPVALQDKRILNSFVLLSFVHFFNLYHNWPVPTINVLVSIIRSPYVVNFFIIVNLVLFFFLKNTLDKKF